MYYLVLILFIKVNQKKIIVQYVLLMQMNLNHLKRKLMLNVILNHVIDFFILNALLT